MALERAPVLRPLTRLPFAEPQEEAGDLIETETFEEVEAPRHRSAERAPSRADSAQQPGEPADATPPDIRIQVSSVETRQLSAPQPSETFEPGQLVAPEPPRRSAVEARPGTIQAFDDVSSAEASPSPPPELLRPMTPHPALRSRTLSTRFERHETSSTDSAPASQAVRDVTEQSLEPAAVEAAPRITVSIGRVEIKALLPTPPSRPAAIAEPPAPRLSLHEYLTRPQRGRA